MLDAMVLCRFLHFTMVLSLFGACLLRPLLIGPAPSAVLDSQLLRCAAGWLHWPFSVEWPGCC